MSSSPIIFRRLALSLPNTFESAHMDHPDFRILSADGKGRIFATLSAEANGKGVLKLTLEQQASFCEELPQVFEPVQGGWGRMGMTYVHLDTAEEDTLLGALTTAHRNVVTKAEAAKPLRSASKRAVCKRSGLKDAGLKGAAAPTAEPTKPKMKE